MGSGLAGAQRARYYRNLSSSRTGRGFLSPQDPPSGGGDYITVEGDPWVVVLGAGAFARAGCGSHKARACKSWAGARYETRKE